MADDYRADSRTTGTVDVGGSAMGEIESAFDSRRDTNAVDDDSGAGSNGRSFFRAARDGTFYVAVTADESGTGTCTLLVDDTTDDFRSDP